MRDEVRRVVEHRNVGEFSGRLVDLLAKVEETELFEIHGNPALIFAEERHENTKTRTL